MRGSVPLRAGLLGAAAVGMALLFSPAAASAATTAATATTAASPSTAPAVKPSTSCKVPSLTVSPASAAAGSKVTVSGVNFSGCSVQGSSVKPTAEISVKVGVATAAKVSEVLATTTTSASGTFSVTVTVPAVPSGGVNKIAIAAVAQDPATKLDYFAVAAIGYPANTTTTTTSSILTGVTRSSETILTGVTSSSSQAVPTAVPAGSGGAGAPGGSNVGLDLAVGGAGLLLVGAGGVVLARRRAAAQH